MEKTRNVDGRVNSIIADHVRRLPKIERLKACIEIAEEKERWVASRACAINLVTELFRKGIYEQIPAAAKEHCLTRQDLDTARKNARKPRIARKMTEAEVNRLVKAYVSEESDFEFESRVRQEIRALLKDIGREDGQR